MAANLRLHAVYSRTHAIFADFLFAGFGIGGMRRWAWIPLVCLTAGCDGVTAVDGTVSDPDGHPLRGAMVSLAVCADSTDHRGRYSLFYIHGGSVDRVTFEASKDGYAPFFRELEAGRDHVLDVILEPISDRSGGDAGLRKPSLSRLRNDRNDGR